MQMILAAAVAAFAIPVVVTGQSWPTPTATGERRPR